MALLQMGMQNRSPRAFSEYLMDQDYLNQGSCDRLVQLYNAVQRRDNNLQVQSHKKVLSQFLIQLTPKESQKFAHTLVTEWVRWQKHCVVGSRAESPPKPVERSINPEERPKFDENLGYETYSEGVNDPQARLKDNESADIVNEQSPKPNRNAAMRNSALRRSREQRNERENRSSMEGLSQINKISEKATSESAFQTNPRSMPPKDNSSRKQLAADMANQRRQKSAVNTQQSSAVKIKVDEASSIAFEYQADGSGMIGNTNLVAKNDESDTLVETYKKSPASGKNSNKNSASRRAAKKNSNSPSQLKKRKADHFGSIPKIPQKVVEVVQLDVVESYGPSDEVNFGTANSQDAKTAGQQRRIVCAQKTTLFDAQDSQYAQKKPLTSRKGSGAIKTSLVNRYSKKYEAPILDRKRTSKQASSTNDLTQNSSNPTAAASRRDDNALPSTLFSNKVKTKDLYRSQVFSAKNSSGKPSTLIVNPNVDKEEAMAGIALLNKHEQAMKRYEEGAKGGQQQQTVLSSDDYVKRGKQSDLKPDWNRSTRSPGGVVTNPYVSLLNETEGYQFIQLKQTSFASNIPETNAEVPEPFNASQSFKELSRQVKGKNNARVDAREMAEIMALQRNKNPNSLLATKDHQQSISNEPDSVQAPTAHSVVSNGSKTRSPTRDLLNRSDAFKTYKENTREVLAASIQSRPSFTTTKSPSVTRKQEQEMPRIEPVHELPPKPQSRTPLRSTSSGQERRPSSTKNQGIFKIKFDKGKETYMMMQGSQTQRVPFVSRSRDVTQKETSLNRDLSSAANSAKGSNQRSSRRRNEPKPKYQQPSLYELSYLDGLKKSSTVTELNTNEYQDQGAKQTAGRKQRKNKKASSPLDYQLEEVDSEQMILQPTPTKSSRNMSSGAQNMAANFAYLSQQVTNKSKAKKSSGSKHLELQKALKAQADKRAAEKRKSSITASAIKNFGERQDASIKNKKDKLEKIQKQNELELQEECSFSPKQTKLSQLTKQKEQMKQLEQEEVKATKKAMKMEVPVLNLLKGKKDPKAGANDRAASQLSAAKERGATGESVLSADPSQKSGFGGSMTNRDLDELLRSARESHKIRNSERPPSSTEKAKKQSVIEKISVPVRQTKTRYQNPKLALDNKKTSQSAAALPPTNPKK